jgi:hypothetical protein
MLILNSMKIFESLYIYIFNINVKLQKGREREGKDC